MDRAEAIKELESIKELEEYHAKKFEENSFQFAATGYKKGAEVYEMAIAALREQEQRCEYCTPVKGDYGYQFGKDFPKDGGNIALCIRWNRDGDATLHSEAFEVEDGEETLKDYSDTPIHRCPMCGRKLGGADYAD